MIPHARPRAALLVPAIALAALTGCVPNAGASATVVTVDSSDDACTVDTARVRTGTVTFRVTNSGSGATEFYLLADDEVSIVAEVEDIAPGTSRDLTVVVAPGDYVTACKPGMVGSGVGQAAFTVDE